MATDAERFRIIADLQLSLTWNTSDKKVVVFWRGPSKPGQPGGYLPIAEGGTLDEAIDIAIEKHKAKLARSKAHGGGAVQSSNE